MEIMRSCERKKESVRGCKRGWNGKQREREVRGDGKGEKRDFKQKQSNKQTESNMTS